MTQTEIEKFREWHENRLKELAYPQHMVEKLRADRERWFPKPKSA